MYTLYNVCVSSLFVCGGVPTQRQEMAAEAKAARMYRDEIETLKVQVYSITYISQCRDCV